MAEGTCKIKRAARAGVQYEMARLAYSIDRAEQDELAESGGWYELRGAFAALLWLNGEWPGPLAPDHVDEKKAEREFQDALKRYHGQFNQSDAADEAEDEADEG